MFVKVVHAFFSTCYLYAFGKTSVYCKDLLGSKIFDPMYLKGGGWGGGRDKHQKRNAEKLTGEC